MKGIEVKILEHNLNGMPKFLAQLTQRGHQINGMQDVINLYEKTIKGIPSKNLMVLPHSTLRRMNHLTIAISGLSTKAVSQLRTHATRLTFISTSTQYSSYENRTDNWVIPEGLSVEAEEKMRKAYTDIENVYTSLIEQGLDKDKVGYLLPQGLRKALIISGNLEEWRYVISLRLCHRNTTEVQHIMHLILKAIIKECGEEYTVGMFPPCVESNCNEGNFCCGKSFKKEELYERYEI